MLWIDKINKKMLQLLKITNKMSMLSKKSRLPKDLQQKKIFNLFLTHLTLKMTRILTMFRMWIMMLIKIWEKMEKIVTYSTLIHQTKIKITYHKPLTSFLLALVNYQEE